MVVTTTYLSCFDNLFRGGGKRAEELSIRFLELLQIIVWIHRHRTLLGVETCFADTFAWAAFILFEGSLVLIAGGAHGCTAAVLLHHYVGLMIVYSLG